jgi:hypothetical protein
MGLLLFVFFLDFLAHLDEHEEKVFLSLGILLVVFVDKERPQDELVKSLEQVSAARFLFVHFSISI